MPTPRYLFGGGVSDFAIAPPSRHGGFVVSAPSLGNGTLWSASTGGAQYADLQTVNGGAASNVSTDSNGSLVPFYGPPGVDGAWIDFGGGSRAFISANQGQDVHVASLLGDGASASTAALSAAGDTRWTQKSGLSSDVADLVNNDASATAAALDARAIRNGDARWTQKTGLSSDVAALIGNDASATASAFDSRANTKGDARWVKKGDVVVNVKDAGAVGDGVTDDTAAIQSVLSTATNITFPAGTYLVDSNVLSINGRSGVTIDMVGRLKRKDNASRGSTLIIFNSSDIKIRSFRSDGNVANNYYGGIAVDEAKHCLRIDGSTDVEIGQIDSINPAGDALYVTGATSRLRIGTVTSRSDAATGRNTMSIVSGSGIKVDSVVCHGTGYTTMPSGFDIEPNSGQSVSDVVVGQVYSRSSGTGGFTIYGNYTVGGVRQISRVKVGHVIVVKGAGVQSNACDVPIKGVTDLTVQSISITQDANATNQAFVVDDADAVDLYIDAATSRGSTVAPNIGAGATVSNMRLRGRVGMSGSHCLQIYRLDNSEIDMKLKSPGSGVLVVKNSVGSSSNVRWRGDWRKVSGVAAMQINGTAEWQLDADLRDWPTSQIVVGTGAAGVSYKSPNSQSVFTFTTPGQSSWTCPIGAKTMRVIAIGGGGGGGSGRRDAAGTNRYGGGGGGAGSRSDITLDASTYAGTALTVTVGTGGTGGAAVAADTTSGATGVTGGWSGVGVGSLQSNTVVNANGGTGGSGGTGTTGTAGFGVAGTSVGSTGGAGTNGTGGTAGWAAATTGGAGGGGGGLTTANAASAGGGGGFPASGYPAYTTAGAVGSNGTNGAASIVPTQGYGGSGGGAANGGAAGNGGSGGTPGGAGGGGGASVNGTNSGAGGDGASGAVQIIVTY